MKTSLKTLITSALTAVVLSSSAFTSIAADKAPHFSLSTEIDFNKVVITGNVNVELVQSNKQKVVIYENYNKATTSVKQKGDKLFINSKEAEPINIVVYVRDLQRIDASNTVSVITRGRFSASVLQVFLKDKARAFVNAETGSLYTLIKDKSELKLRGTSKDHVSVKGSVAKLRTEQFLALKTTNSSVDGELLAQEYALDALRDTVIAERMIR
jgi:hypothetical protein